MAQVKELVFKKACDDFLKLQAEIQSLKDTLKQMNKENKGNIQLIKEHMDENELSEYDVGGYVFYRKEVERCSWNEKNLEEIIDDQSILSRYREQFTKTKQSFSVKNPKKRSRND